MHARVSTYEIPPDGIDRAVEGFESTGLETWDGFERAYLLVDRSTGKSLTITMWESEEALRASAERANEARSQIMEDASGSVANVEHYEIASVAERSRTTA